MPASNPLPASDEIRIVLGQLGAFIELHRPGHEHPIVTVGRLHNSDMAAYRAELIERNPDMQYASVEQVVKGTAEWWFEAVRKSIPSVTLNHRLYSYNASEDRYEVL